MNGIGVGFAMAGLGFGGTSLFKTEVIVFAIVVLIVLFIGFITNWGDNSDEE